MRTCTPGPWYATGVHVQSAVINEDNYVCEAEGSTQEQAEANALIIAAAPELLEAVNQVLRASEDNGDMDDIDWNLLRAAVAKAGGAS